MHYLHCGLTRVQIAVADLHSNILDARPPPPGGPNSFNFMQFLGKLGKIVCWAPPPEELAPPPRGNPGSATELGNYHSKGRNSTDVILCKQSCITGEEKPMVRNYFTKTQHRIYLVKFHVYACLIGFFKTQPLVDWGRGQHPHLEVQYCHLMIRLDEADQFLKE